MKHSLFFGGASNWLGQGVIQLNVSTDRLPFYARWTVSEGGEGEIIVLQELEIEGVEDKLENNLLIKNIVKDRFDIVIKNDIWGEADGWGRIYDEKVAWEVRKHGKGFEGLEVYKVIGEDRYALSADYVSPNSYRTHIDGKLWKTG